MDKKNNDNKNENLFHEKTCFYFSFSVKFIDFLKVICFQTIIILIHFSISNFYCSVSILRCKGKEFPVYLGSGQHGRG